MASAVLTQAKGLARAFRLGVKASICGEFLDAAEVAPAHGAAGEDASG